MEPFRDDSERSDIDRRRMYFSADKNYQTRWIDRGTYSLGTEGDPNWQPGFGYWQYDEGLELLICNKGLPYEFRYKVTIQSNGLELIRECDRFMSSSYNNPNNSSDPSWSRSETVKYVETFVKIQD